ncbi:UDP-glucose 4-epimerase [Pseudochelatococcus lubricantis]|uniref:UDP-glucose 4-epimerase n=1 Tax=Pseudochelatococcus lubricantis TaxID=1538102 RepID=A0ABX0UW19_9HYPH|nr:NAD-dependent epimerase/dehydratase family protein [Pseudochelatococcus lubricantis]NIJ57151.1 UDP-glucose 4-epimerase [Pseudochelatococcus lubricantis]
MRILLTGATGFIGRHLVASLQRGGHTVRAALREEIPVAPGVERAVVGDIGGSPDWRPALAGVDAVIHAAGIAHAGPDVPPERYHRVNHAATLHLAHAARGRVERFVFLSSIRAQTGPSSPAVQRETDDPYPTDDYGRSKLAAERGLAEIDDLFAVSLRPVLVYGPGVRGNMGALIGLARLPIPLPFGALRARRSLVAVETVAEAVAHLLTTRDAAGKPPAGPFIVADRVPVNVGEIIAALRAGQGRRPGLLSVPVPLLRAGLSPLGRAALLERLDSPLVVEGLRLAQSGFTPSVSSREGLRRLGALLARRRTDGEQNRE